MRRPGRAPASRPGPPSGPARCARPAAASPSPSEEDRVTRIRGDRDDVFSHGFICPKGSTLKQLHEDPDRVRTPLVKRDGRFVEATWAEAFAEVERGLTAVFDAHGREAVAVYLGNPNAHTLAGQLYARPLHPGPRHAERVLGQHGRPAAQGDRRRDDVRSRAHRPGARRRPHRPPVRARRQPLRVERQPGHGAGLARPHRGAAGPGRPAGGRRPAPQPHRRGGRRVGRRSGRAPTACCWRRWCARCSTRAWSTSATSRRTSRASTGSARRWRRSPPRTSPRRPASRPRPSAGSPASSRPPSAPSSTGASAPRPPSSAPSPAGWSTCSTPAPATSTGPAAPCSPGPRRARRTPAGTPRYGREVRIGRRHSRVRGLPESLGELPAVCLAEEIDTPGEGQVRAFVCLAGNPVLSTPNGGRLDAALEGLEFMVAVDIYVNETSRHADVILPAPSALQKGALRPRAPPARPAQRRQLVRARPAARRRASSTSGRCSPGWRSSPRAWAPTPMPPRSTT